MTSCPRATGSRFVPAAVFALLLLCFEAVAAEHKLTVRGSRFASLESVQALAAATAQESYVVPAGGQTLKEVIESKCGDGNREEVVDALVMWLFDLNPSTASFNTKLESGTVIQVPFCAPVFKNRKVKARDGDTLESVLFANHPGGPTKRIYEAAVKLNSELVERECATSRKRKQECVVRAEDGDIITVPYTAPWATGILTSEQSLSVPALENLGKVTFNTPDNNSQAMKWTSSDLKWLDSLDRRKTTSSLYLPHNGQTWAFQAFSFDQANDGVIRDPSGEPITAQPLKGALNVIQPLSENELSKDDVCKQASADTYPFDVVGVKERVERGIKKLHESGGRSNRPVVIAVIDTGISETVFLKKAMPENIFYKKLGEKINNKDDFPPNGFVDDIHGINANRTGEVTELSGHTPKSKNHGTHVTTMALGGKRFLNSILTSGSPSPIRVAVIRPSKYIGRKPELVPGSIREAMEDWIRKEPIDVVNVSLDHDQASAVSAYNSVLRGSRILVAAAGNEGRNMNQKLVFPAALTGPGQNVISVGAHDQEGKLLRSSNWGDKVDIYAPGCGFPLISENAQEVFDSGTSFAAPLVSFTAALLKGLGLGNGLVIKNRILTSGDLLHEDRAKLGRRLNIYKALSLYDDVIELREPVTNWKEENSPVVGHLKLQNRNDLYQFFCDDAVLRKSWGESGADRPPGPYLLKVDIYEDKQGKLRADFVTANSLQQLDSKSWSCPLRAEEIEFIESGSDQLRSIPTRKFKDIVLRHLW